MIKQKLSIIIPAYSEEENIPNLLDEIGKAFLDNNNFEVVIVDDGSPVSLEDVLKDKSYSFKTIIISNKYIKYL